MAPQCLVLPNFCSTTGVEPQLHAGSNVSALDLVLNHCANKARLKLCATQGGINNQLHCRRSWLFKCFLRSAQVLPSFGTTVSFVRRKYFLCYPAQEISSFGASASFVQRKCFLRSAQLFPSFGASATSAIRRKRFLCQTDMSDRETDSVRRTCQTETDNVRRTCRTERQTASDGRVEQRDGQRQTDVSDKDGQRQTDVSDRDGRRWTSVADTEIRRKRRKRRKRRRG